MINNSTANNNNNNNMRFQLLTLYCQYHEEYFSNYNNVSTYNN